MTAKIHLSRARGPSEDVAASIHDDGLVLLHVAEGRLFASNQVGARIWLGLERRLPIDTIAADLSRHYGIPHDCASAHTERFLAELQRERLIEWRTAK